jgi:hypothetical protein
MDVHRSRRTATTLSHVSTSCNPRLFFTAAAGLVICVALSGQIAFARWLHTGFCDTAEQDCSLPWTSARVLTWGLWGAVGLALLTSMIFSLREEGRNAAVVSLGLAVALAAAATLSYQAVS